MPLITPIDNILTDVLDRLVLMEKTTNDFTDAVAAAFYAQEATPFWVNRVDSVQQELESEQAVNVTFGITARLVVSYLTQDYELAAERMVAQLLPKILYYFSARRALMNTQTDDPIRYLRPEGAIITDADVVYGAQQTGIGAQQFAIDFTFEIPMYYMSDQAVF